jgi:hypothetical protein
VAETYEIEVPLDQTCGVDGFIDLKGGRLTIKKGYAFDGPSGPTFDTKSFMRGSLVHDALYQLIREGKIDQSCRADADKLLRKICREDGMSWLRSRWVYHSVRMFGGAAARPSAIRKVETAP